MAKKIIWSKNSLIELSQILSYWDVKIGNTKYSDELEEELYNSVEYLSFFPQLGHQYKATTYRYLIFRDYKIFYNQKDNFLEILYICDTRRNPKNLTI